MKFSVLMSVYAREEARFLDQALRSVLNQSAVPDQVVVVKDGPLTEELEAVLEGYIVEFPGIMKIVPLDVNMGLGEALNRGLEHTSHELVARMDSDDIARPDRFEKQLAVFASDPDIAVAGSWIDEFEGDTDNIISTRMLPETPDRLKTYCGSRCPLNHPSVMFRAAAVKAVGGYRHFHLLEDYFLWGRLVAAGYKLYNIQESLLWFRSSPQMFRRRGGWKYARSEARLMKEFRRMGILSRGRMVRNIAIRFPVRIMPGPVRAMIYKRLLR